MKENNKIKRHIGGASLHGLGVIIRTVDAESERRFSSELRYCKYYGGVSRVRQQKVRASLSTGIRSIARVVRDDNASRSKILF
jgi:hypothetical protein